MVIAAIAGTLLGSLSGLGTGGGSLLILWLTLVLDHSAGQARAINLMFFIPSAVVACLFRKRQGCLPLKKAFPGMLGACIGALAFSILSIWCSGQWIRKVFGILLLYTGIRELTYRER